MLLALSSSPAFLMFGHGYHQCLPFRFTTPIFIPPYLICSSCQCLVCLALFNLYDHQPIQHCNLICIFNFHLFLFVFSSMRWQERPSRDLCMPLSIYSKWLGNTIEGAHD
jgi:hypothetical protein